MVNYNAPRYAYPAETWDEKKCAKMAKRIAKDGLGTPYHFRGAVPYLSTGEVYNGGTVIDGEWYQGWTRPLPILAPGYSWVRVPTWCWRIVKDEPCKP